MNSRELASIQLVDTIEEQLSSINPRLVDSLCETSNLKTLINFAINKREDFFRQIMQSKTSGSNFQSPLIPSIGGSIQSINSNSNQNSNNALTQLEIKRIQHISMFIITGNNSGINRSLFHSENTKEYLDLVSKAFFDMLNQSNNKNVVSSTSMDNSNYTGVSSLSITEEELGSMFQDSEGRISEKLLEKYNIDNICIILENWLDKEQNLLFSYFCQENLAVFEFLIDNLSLSSNQSLLILKLQSSPPNQRKGSNNGSFVMQDDGKIDPMKASENFELGGHDKDIATKAKVLNLWLKKMVEFLYWDINWDNYSKFIQLYDIFLDFLNKNYSNYDNRFVLEIIMNSKIYKDVIYECKDFFNRNFKKLTKSPSYKTLEKLKKLSVNELEDYQFIRNGLMMYINKIQFRILEDQTNLVKMGVTSNGSFVGTNPSGGANNLELSCSSQRESFIFDDMSMNQSQNLQISVINIDKILGKDIIKFYIDFWKFLSDDVKYTEETMMLFDSGANSSSNSKKLILELISINTALFKTFPKLFMKTIGIDRIFVIIEKHFLKYTTSDMIINQIEKQLLRISIVVKNEENLMSLESEIEETPTGNLETGFLEQAPRCSKFNYDDNFGLDDKIQYKVNIFKKKFVFEMRWADMVIKFQYQYKLLLQNFYDIYDFDPNQDGSGKKLMEIKRKNDAIEKQKEQEKKLVNAKGSAIQVIVNKSMKDHINELTSLKNLLTRLIKKNYLSPVETILKNDKKLYKDLKDTNFVKISKFQLKFREQQIEIDMISLGSSNRLNLNEIANKAGDKNDKDGGKKANGMIIRDKAEEELLTGKETKELGKFLEHQKIKKMLTEITETAQREKQLQKIDDTVSSLGSESDIKNNSATNLNKDTISTQRNSKEVGRLSEGARGRKKALGLTKNISYEKDNTNAWKDFQPESEKKMTKSEVQGNKKGTLANVWDVNIENFKNLVEKLERNKYGSPMPSNELRKKSEAQQKGNSFIKKVVQNDQDRISQNLSISQTLKDEAITNSGDYSQHKKNHKGASLVQLKSDIEDTDQKDNFMKKAMCYKKDPHIPNHRHLTGESRTICEKRKASGCLIKQKSQQFIKSDNEDAPINSKCALKRIPTFVVDADISSLVHSTSKRNIIGKNQKNKVNLQQKLRSNSRLNENVNINSKGGILSCSPGSQPNVGNFKSWDLGPPANSKNNEVVDNMSVTLEGVRKTSKMDGDAGLFLERKSLKSNFINKDGIVDGGSNKNNVDNTSQDKTASDKNMKSESGEHQQQYQDYLQKYQQQLQQQSHYGFSDNLVRNHHSSDLDRNSMTFHEQPRITIKTQPKKERKLLDEWKPITSSEIRIFNDIDEVVYSFKKIQIISQSETENNTNTDNKGLEVIDENISGLTIICPDKKQLEKGSSMVVDNRSCGGEDSGFWFSGDCSTNLNNKSGDIRYMTKDNVFNTDNDSRKYNDINIATELSCSPDRDTQPRINKEIQIDAESRTNSSDKKVTFFRKINPEHDQQRKGHKYKKMQTTYSKG